MADYAVKISSYDGFSAIPPEPEWISQVDYRHEKTYDSAASRSIIIL